MKTQRLKGNVRWCPWANVGVVTIALIIWASVSLGSAAAEAMPGDRSPGDELTGDNSTRDNVVLLHGLGRTRANMLILKWRLESKGYRVCNVGYDTRVDSIELASDDVFDSLSQCVDADRRTHFVTHSLGGLVLRSLLDRHSIPTASRAVMLAPPNQGSEIADWIRGLPLTSPLMGQLASQLGTRTEDLPGDLPPPPIGFGVIAGDRWINPAGPIFLPPPHDGTVSVASTRLAGMSDHIVLPYTHTFIVNAAEVADQIDVFLRSGRFRRREAESERDR